VPAPVIGLDMRWPRGRTAYVRFGAAAFCSADIPRRRVGMLHEITG
jgi:hypothetical protein